MNRHPKPPYRRPLNPAWRPAMESLDQALDQFLDRRTLEARRWRFYELFGVDSYSPPSRDWKKSHE